MNRLILALIICCGLTACDNNGTKKSASTDVEQAQQLEQKDHVEVLYFHGKQRCATCMAIEKNAKEVVEVQFANELKNGTLVFSKLILCYMSQSSTHMLCSTFVSAKIRHGNLKTSVFNFCGSMLPGFADFNAKNNKKNLHDCNGYMNNDELRNTLKFSQLSRYANKQATTKLPRYTQSVAWLHSVHLLCTRQSVNGANRDHYTNK